MKNTRASDIGQAGKSGAWGARRWACAAMWILMGLLLASGCEQKTDDRTPDGRVIVDYWEKWTSIEGEAIRAVVDDFNASQDRIFVRLLTVSQIDQKLLLATAGGNPPDVSGLWSHTMNVFAEKGALIPLDEELARVGVTGDRYIPIFWKLCQHRGHTWGIPTTPATMALHWNKKLFREAGLDPDRPPQSLAELDAMAERLTIVEVMRDGRPQRVRYPDLTDAEKQAKDFSIVQLGHSPAEPGWWAQMWGYWFGGQLWDGESRITLTTPENLRAFDWYQSYPRKFGWRNLRHFGSSFGNFSSPQNPFLSGKLAMVLHGVWMQNFISKYAPDMEWGAAPFPSVDPQKWPGVTVLECDSLVIPRGARHVPEAMEFLKYMASQRACEMLNLAQRKFSPLEEVSDEFFQQHPNPYIRVFIDLAHSPHAGYVPRVPIWNEFRDEINAALDRLLSMTATPQESLRVAQERSQWKLDRALHRWSLVQEQRMQEWRR